MIISLIVAHSENRVIGNRNKLPWHIPEELKYFKQVTLGKPIIMGRNTFESMGKKPLNGRQNIILTRKMDLPMDGIIVAHSIEEVLKICEKSEEVMVIGGETVYQQFLPLATRLYITIIHAYYEGDAFFPAVDIKQWKRISENKGSVFTTTVLERL